MEVNVMVQHFTSATFEQAIAGDQAVLVDFWAPWCGPCRMIAPLIEEIAAEFDGRAVVGKVDVDEEPGLAQRFGVMSIPTIVTLKNGEEYSRATGARPKGAILSLLA